MGKARILEAHGEGRYTIEIIEARERAEFAKQEAEARIQTLRSEILSLEQRITSAQTAVNQAAAAQDAAINQYQQEMTELGQSSVNLEERAQALLKAASQRDALRTEQRSKALRVTADEALVARINALPPLRQMQAWCADYTEDLSGEVATAEVPGEIGNVIIKPGFEGSTWSATEDGAIQPTQASTPAATFYNLAMLPGWQKWRPTFRTATITSLDGDTCSISLDAATSSQRGLNINVQGSYSGVPILYMDCNGGAFEEGDRVLVAFSGNVDGPTVVGFEQGPKACFANFGFFSTFGDIYDGSATIDVMYRRSDSNYTTNEIEYIGHYGPLVAVPRGGAVSSARTIEDDASVEESFYVAPAEDYSHERPRYYGTTRWEAECRFNWVTSRVIRVASEHFALTDLEELYDGSWLYRGGEWRCLESTIECDGVTVNLAAMGLFLDNTHLESSFHYGYEGVYLPEISTSISSPDFRSTTNYFSAQTHPKGLLVTVGVRAREEPGDGVYRTSLNWLYASFMVPKQGATYRVKSPMFSVLPDDGNYPDA